MMVKCNRNIINQYDGWWWYIIICHTYSSVYDVYAYVQLDKYIVCRHNFIYKKDMETYMWWPFFVGSPAGLPTSRHLRIPRVLVERLECLLFSGCLTILEANSINVWCSNRMRDAPTPVAWWFQTHLVFDLVVARWSQFHRYVRRGLERKSVSGGHSGKLVTAACFRDDAACHLGKMQQAAHECQEFKSSHTKLQGV